VVVQREEVQQEEVHLARGGVRHTMVVEVHREGGRGQGVEVEQLHKREVLGKAAAEAYRETSDNSRHDCRSPVDVFT